MANTNEIKQTNLFKSLQYIRLQQDVKHVKSELQANTAKPATENEGFFKRALRVVGNEIKNSKTNTLLCKQSSIESQYNNFLKNANGTDILLYSESEIPAIVKDVFSNDVYTIEKTMFSISIIFDGEYDYSYKSEGLSSVSYLLWGSYYKLDEIKNGLEAIYKDLYKQPWSTEQKIVLGGTAALLLFTSTIPALTLGGLSASGITGGLAGFGTALGIGGSMAAGVGLMTIAEILLDCALIGFTYAALDAHHKNVVKKTFREMTYSNAARMLAIKCYLMSVAKNTMPKDLFKEKMSELLQMVSDFKSDTDYVLLIEGENVEENKKKINVFHNLDKRLSKMFCC